MIYQKRGETYFLQLKVGDEVMESLRSIARDEEIGAASITAIGAVSDPEIGYFNVTSKEYDRISLTGNFELVGLTGNIGWRDGEPLIHAHVVLGSPTGVHAGHLFRGTICVTGEFVITRHEGRLERRLDPEVNLPLWDLT